MLQFKKHLYHTLRLIVTLMTFSALLFNTFAITLAQGGASSDGNNSAASVISAPLPLFTNGGFEDPLGAEWAETVTGGNGDGRVPLNQAYAGSYVYLFQANGGWEFIKQTVVQGGTAGDEYTLAFYFGGRDVDLSGKVGAKLVFMNGGAKVNQQRCNFIPPSTSFSWTSFSCIATATGAFDSIEVYIGIHIMPSGTVGVDAALLNLTTPGTISGGVWKDLNGNGVINGGEPGFSGVTVRLGQGACLITGYRTELTAVNGSYSFTNVPPGTYCVSVNIIVECGGWIATTATQHTIILDPGENQFVSWIGYANYIC